MKKKMLKFSVILTIVLFAITTVFFFLMKNADKGVNSEVQTDTKVVSEEYDVSQIVEKIEFLKLNTYDEIKKYDENSQIYIQTSDDKTLFAIGELYVEDIPVKVFYRLNSDGSINRIDGSYSLKISSKSAAEVQEKFLIFNDLFSEFFGVTTFNHDFYDENGGKIYSFDDHIYEDLLNGEVYYGLSVIDKENTYWYISADITNQEQINLEFLRCFDLREYNDYSPDIDLRTSEEQESK